MVLTLLLLFVPSQWAPVIIILLKASGDPHKGSRDGAVVEHLSPTQASHQCGPGSNPGLDAICGLSLLLVLFLAPRGFPQGTPVFPSPQKPTFPNSISIWNFRTSLKTTMVRGASWLNITIHYYFLARNDSPSCESQQQYTIENGFCAFWNVQETYYMSMRRQQWILAKLSIAYQTMIYSFSEKSLVKIVTTKILALQCNLKGGFIDRKPWSPSISQ